MSKTIGEIILVVTHQRSVAILDESGFGALSSSSVISFQGASSRILGGNGIRMISPNVFKKLFEIQLIFNALTFDDNSQLL